MQIISVNEKNLHLIQQNSEPVVMALGFFDGVHKGHQHVINAAKRKAQSLEIPLAVMSFFPHPKTVFSNEEIDYLMPLEQKAARFKVLGVDIFYIVEFTKSFAALLPQQFIAQYLLALQVKCAVAGFDYTYGAKGAGTIQQLEVSSNGQIAVEIVEKYALDGEKVSSTCIRGLLKRGQVEEVTALLGVPHKVKYSSQNGLLPYYTLPESGYYYVTMAIEQRAISQRIYVCTKAIHFDHELAFDECTIVFHQRMEQQLQVPS